MTMERLLVLVRHGQSEWNLKNLFTGWKNPELTDKGIAEARAGERGIKLLVPEGEPVPEKKVHLAFDPVHAYLYEDGWLAGDRP